MQMYTWLLLATLCAPKLSAACLTLCAADVMLQFNSYRMGGDVTFILSELVSN